MSIPAAFSAEELEMLQWHRSLTRNNAYLRQGLGEWAEEAFTETGVCRRPVLREYLFVEHLGEQADMRPSGQCKATFGWAKLLYALNIRPGSNIIEWESLGIDPENYRTVKLELEGPVLCHIVNLYQIYDNPYGVPLNDHPSIFSQGVTWQFPFGALTINPEHDGRQLSNVAGVIPEPKEWTATFSPSSDQALSAPRQPFLARGQPLPFEGESIADQSVWTAQRDIVWQGYLELPLYDRFTARCRSLCKCLDILVPERDSSIPNRHDSCEGAPKRTDFVTPTWIEQANDIKRGATTNGGEDNGLSELMVEFLSQKPTVVEEITNLMRTTGCSNEDWEEAVRQEVKRLCFYKNDTFEFSWDYPDHSDDSFSIKDIVVRELPSALSTSGPGSPERWVGYSSERVPEAMKILLHQKIINPLLLVLQLTKEHPLWKPTYYLQ
ncbi:hypothetical protein F4680DRAFT_468024 [Xylaria scruposa]|nr:hypothetical protein F4680DRAFT_468024 [Xylaria scruposa]